MAPAPVISFRRLMVSCNFNKMFMPRLQYCSQIAKQTSLFLEILYIIWVCLYITILGCVLWKFVFTMDLANINYFCSWFLVIQIFFYSSFLISYVGCLEHFQRIINAIFFPVVYGLAWTITVVSVSGTDQAYLDFNDIRYFILHVLPTVVSSGHEIFISIETDCNVAGERSKIRTLWCICAPILFLGLYAINIDHTEVYRYQVKPPSYWLVLGICVIANVRLVFFPFSCK